MGVVCSCSDFCNCWWFLSRLFPSEKSKNIKTFYVSHVENPTQTLPTNFIIRLDRGKILSGVHNILTCRFTYIRPLLSDSWCKHRPLVVSTGGSTIPMTLSPQPKTPGLTMETHPSDCTTTNPLLLFISAEWLLGRVGMVPFCLLYAEAGVGGRRPPRPRKMKNRYIVLCCVVEDCLDSGIHQCLLPIVASCHRQIRAPHRF